MDKKIAIYCRVSTDKEDQLNSLENQKLIFLEKIENDKDTIYGIYADEGLSGTKLNNRKEFNKMLEAAGIDVIESIAEKVLPNGNLDKRVKRKSVNFVLSDRVPLFNYIYVKNTSRFARNTLSYDIVCKLRQKNVHIYFLEQNIDTSSYSQDLLLQLWQVFDANDSRDKSSKVITGLRQSAKNNVIHTNKRIYGYNYNEIDNSLTQVPEEAEVIKYIYLLYYQGFGVRQIINKCNEKGYYTRDGKEFGKTTIKRILDNEKYCGLNQMLKWDSGVVFAKESYPKIREGYTAVPNDRIEAIISPELFYKCRDIRLSKVNSEVSRGIYNGVSLYAGKVHCAKCKSIYISDKDKNKDSIREFYRCKTKKLKGVSSCNSRNIKKSELDELIERDYNNKVLERIYKDTLSLLEQQKEHLRYIFIQDNTERIKNIKNKINILKNEIKTSFREYSAGKLLEVIYLEIIEEDNKEIKRLELELEELETPINQYNLELDEVNIKISKIENKIKAGFTKEDYIKNVSFIVLSSKIISEYNILDFKKEQSKVLKLSKKKYHL